MEGQWLGCFNGTNNGYMTLNIEKVDEKWYGVFYAISSEGRILSFAGDFYFFDIENIDCKTDNVVIIHPTRYCVTHPTEDVSNFFNNQVAFPSSANVLIHKEDGLLVIRIKTNVDDEIEAILAKDGILDGEDERIDAEVLSWDAFKTKISGTAYRKKIFRGQEDIWPLRTSFHRHNRYDFHRYISLDLPMLLRHLSSLTTHVFNLDNHFEVGAFYNLVQHHGYPTPLLDWTYSPYVAAFFAFRNISNESRKKERLSECIRIFVFDADAWRNDYPQFSAFNDCRLHLSIAEYLSINNVRSIPQQALTTITNINSIEDYIRRCEKTMKKKYLMAFDIPVSEKNYVDRDLMLMGVTAGALFPGLDGACEHLKKINFNA